MAILPALIGAGASLLGTYMDNKAQKSAIQQQNVFNQQQYEDWKYYNSIDQQVRRLNAVGINPQSMTLSNTLPSAYQQDNAVVERSPLAGLASAFGKGFANYYQIKDYKLRKEQLKVNQQMKEEVLKFQREQLRDLNAFRKAQIGFGLDKLDYADRWQQRKFDLMAEQNAFRRDFYQNPDYLGYWNVKGSKQRIAFNDEYNPIILATSRAKMTQAKTFAKHFEDYLNAQIAGMSAQSSYRQAQSDFYNEMFYDDLATQKALNAASRNQSIIQSSKFARGWNFGMKMLNDVFDVAGKGMSLWKGKGLFVPTSQQSVNPYAGYNYNVSY